MTAVRLGLKTRFGLMFVVHQVIVLWVVVISVSILTASGLNFSRLFGYHDVDRAYGWIVYGAPYFLPYIALGLLLGWLLSRSLMDQSMWWVWVLPTLSLGYALIAIPTLTPHLVPAVFQSGVGQPRFEHYFAPGCEAGGYCLDQTSFTRPFYDSIAYSAGSFIGFKRSKPSNPSAVSQVWILSIVGVLFFLAAICDLFVSLHIGGWRWQLLPIEGTVAGMGLYLILLALGAAGKRMTPSSRLVG